MKKLFLLLFTAFYMPLFLSAQANNYTVRIAFLGNSITEGSGLTDPANNSYPGQVAQMLTDIYGDTCEVFNAGVSGRTLLKKGDYPLWDEDKFSQAWYYAPDIVFIMLGTNDTKPYNWDDYGNEFYGDYQAMIDTFALRNPNCKFIIAYPPPAFGIVYDIRDSVIVAGVNPVIDQIIEDNDFEYVDFYTALKDSAHLFYDKIHPSVEGSAIMANMVVDKIVETDYVHNVEQGYTYVTNLKTSRYLIAQNAELTVSWETRNADSVYFDNQKVDLSGSLVFTPEDVTTYTVTAYGEKNTDIQQITQDVYIPELSDAKLTPRLARIEVGESVDLTLFVYDQYNKVIENHDYPVTWSVLGDLGTIDSDGGTTATFVGTKPGEVMVAVTVGDYTAEAEMRISGTSAFDFLEETTNIEVYPNPVSNTIALRGKVEQYSSYTIMNIDGKILKLGKLEGDCIDVSEVDNGVYILQLESDGKKKAVKFLKNR
jgi:lysophospholipase L1-like esterase